MNGRAVYGSDIQYEYIEEVANTNATPQSYYVRDAKILQYIGPVMAQAPPDWGETVLAQPLDGGVSRSKRPPPSWRRSLAEDGEKSRFGSISPPIRTHVRSFHAHNLNFTQRKYLFPPSTLCEVPFAELCRQGTRIVFSRGR